MVTASESSTDQRMLIWELTLYNMVFRYVQHHSELNLVIIKNAQGWFFKKPRRRGGTSWAINEEEAALHRCTLEEVFDTMANRVKDRDESALKQAIIDCKMAITMVMPPMADTNPTIVLEAIKDPSCLAICPHTDESI